MSITVQLKFWGVFKDYLQQNTLQIPKQSTLKDLVTILQQHDVNNILQTKSIFAIVVNGMIQNDMAYIIKDNDAIDFLPPVTGG